MSSVLVLGPKRHPPLGILDRVLESRGKCFDLHESLEYSRACLAQVLGLTELPVCKIDLVFAQGEPFEKIAAIELRRLR
jgi:hypothetical protein